MPKIGPDDVRLSGRLCRETLEPHVERDWSVPAKGLEWECRQTVGHIADALGFYAAHLAARAEKWLKFDVVPHLDASNLHLLRLVEAMSNMLAQVAQATPDDVLAFHHTGMRDQHAFCAMACLEMIVHTGDVAGGLNVPFDPPRDLCEQVISSLFPDAPSNNDPWEVLLWATGRADLSDHAALGPGWQWVRSAYRGDVPC